MASRSKESGDHVEDCPAFLATWNSLAAEGWYSFSSDLYLFPPWLINVVVDLLQTQRSRMFLGRCCYLWWGWRWIKLLSQPPKRADSCKPITASYLFPPKLYYAARSRCFLEPVTNADNFSLTLLYGPNRRICKGRNDRIPNQKNRNGIEFKQPYLASVFVSLHRVSFLGWSRAM